MNNLKIISYFKGDDNSVFLELKRLDYKNSLDKSQYVRWFRIKNNIPKQLRFVKMNDKCRFFNEGQLIIDKNDIQFIENKNIINLKYCYINLDCIRLCAENWNTNKIEKK
jgi:hypothetical protein